MPRAELALVFVTVLWGTSFAFMKDALTDTSPLLFTGLRFFIATLLLAPVLIRARGDRRTWLDGLVLGVLLFAAFATQIRGLTTISAGRSAFLTSTCSLMVPFIEYAITGRKPAPRVVVGILVALAGVYYLTDPRGGVVALATGDLLTLACALLYAIYLVHLDTTTKRGQLETLLLAQLGTCALLGVALSPLFETPRFSPTPDALGALAALAIGSTAIAIYLQNRFQSRTTPTRAAVIYAAEPVFAAGFAALYLAEPLGPRMLGGGAVILCGILLAVAREPAAPAPIA